MVRYIVRKELLVNLLSMRFALGLVVVALVMGLVGYVLTEDYVGRRQTYLSDVQRHQETLRQTKVYSTIEVTIDIPPPLLSVFGRGVKDLPSSIRVSPYHVPSLFEGGSSSSIDFWSTSDRPYNPLLRFFTPIDLSFVIGIILSLFAILLVFDSFSGERERGTLGLMLSCPIGRVQVLIGKFLGALLTMAIPLTIGFLEVILLWALSPEVTLDTSSWVGVGLIYLFSLIFLSGFLALGLLISLFAKESSSGLMYILLVWIVVAVVIPEGGGYLAEYAWPWEARRNVVEKLKEKEDKFYKALRKVEYHQKCAWWYANTNDMGGESLLGITEEEVYNRLEYNKKVFPLKFQYAEDRYRVLESYAAALRRWARIRDNLIRPSLCVLYRNIVQAISGTDIGSYDAMLRQAREYREALMSYLRPKVETPEWFTRALEYPDMQPTEENVKYWMKLAEKEGVGILFAKILNWDRITPLDLSDMPRPQVKCPDLAERVVGVTTDALLLVGITGLFLGLATMKVLKYTP